MTSPPGASCRPARRRRSSSCCRRTAAQFPSKALQTGAIDAPAATPGVADGSDDVGSSVAHGIRAGASAANGAGDSGSSGATPQPAPETPSAAVDESPLKPITENLAAVMEYSNAKIDEVQSRSPRHLTALALPVAASCGAPS